ncbi:MAG TPA: hypothetical protein VFX98_01705 [Longimicrobiaceae bacterium]|nr:hypothetical protein [Longimicrobiaceae bacterium]
MKLRRLLLVLAVLLAAAAPRTLAAQRPPQPLEGFVQSVARLWERGDAGDLVKLAPASGRILLDVGTGGPGAVEERHAAAALRSLFGERETVSVRPTGVTLSGGSPISGFGELAWVSRLRGVSDTQGTTVYVGAVWEDGAWRIRELRILQ